MRYVTYNSTGELTGFYFQEVQPEHENCHIEVTPELATSWCQFSFSSEDGQLVKRENTFNIQAEKIKVNSLINAWRLAKNSSTFPYLGKEIACDALSRSDLDGTANYIAMFGEFPVEFPGAWKAVDNTYIPLDTIDDFKEMYKAMVDQGHANFMHAQQLKAQLAAATTPEAVEAVKEALTDVQ